VSHEELPEDVLRLLNNCIDSVEQLSVLLLLHSQPDRVWSNFEITAELRSADNSISKRLDDLYQRNILVRLPEMEGGHKFSPSTAEVARVVQRLAEQNRMKPYRVIESIYSRPNKALQAFADAFNLRGNK
jgi:hypothetical protein